MVEHENADPDDEETIHFIQGTDTIYTWVAKSILGDSNSISVNVGDFDIEGDTLILYNFWAKAGDAPVSPYGARIQRYKFSEDGNISFINGDIYIETISNYYIHQKEGKEELDYHVGCQYLNRLLKTVTEKEALKRYVEGVEKEYNAHFVFGKRAKSLIDRARMRLSKYLIFYTGKWDKMYYDNGFGFRN